MKVWYKNEKDTGKVICYIISVALIAVWIYMIFMQLTKYGATNNPLFYTLVIFVIESVAFGFLTYLVFRCGQVASIGVQNRREWHEYLVKHGIKCEGCVVEIIEEKIRKASSDYTKYEYFFRIRYYSLLSGRENTFVTTALSFKPQKGREYLCDVYEIAELPGEKQKPEGEMLYSFSFNPFRMLNTIEENKQGERFENVVAEGFR